MVILGGSRKNVLKVDGAMFAATAAGIASAVLAARDGDTVQIAAAAQASFFFGATPLTIDKSIKLIAEPAIEIEHPQVRFYGGSEITTWTPVAGNTYSAACPTNPWSVWLVDNLARRATNVGSQADMVSHPCGQYIAWSVDAATTAALLNAQATGAWSWNAGILYIKAPDVVANAAAWNSYNPASGTVLAVLSENVIKTSEGVVDLQIDGIEFTGARYSVGDIAHGENFLFSNLGFHGGYDIRTSGVSGGATQNGLRLTGPRHADLHNIVCALNGNDGLSVKGPGKVNLRVGSFFRNRDDGVSPHDGAYMDIDGIDASENGWSFTGLGTSNTSSGGLQIVQSSRVLCKNSQFNRNGGNGVWNADNAKGGSWFAGENVSCSGNVQNGFQFDGSSGILSNCHSSLHTDGTQGYGYKMSQTNPTTGYRANATLIRCSASGNRIGFYSGGIDCHVSAIQYWDNTTRETTGSRTPAGAASADATQYTFRSA